MFSRLFGIEKACVSKPYLPLRTRTHTHRILHTGRVLVADAANNGYQLSNGRFSLPHVTLVYTPQCYQYVLMARDIHSADDLDEAAVMDMEEATFSPKGDSHRAQMQLH